MRYVAICVPGLTILLSFPYYYITTYCVTLGYTTKSSRTNVTLTRIRRPPKKRGVGLGAPHLLAAAPLMSAVGKCLLFGLEIFFWICIQYQNT
jgi:hypothetical protein